MFDLIYWIRIVGSRLLGYLLLFIAIVDRRFELGKNVNFRGSILFELERSCKIKLGHNTLLNGSSHGYHLSHSFPAKIKCKKNAIISVGNNCRIHGALIHAGAQIEIGDNVLIASGVKIFDSNGHELCVSKPELRLNSSDKPRPIKIGNNVWICTDVIILPGSVIDDGAVIGARSVVSGHVETAKIFKN